MPLADRQTAVIGFFKEQSGPLCSVGVPSERVQRREVGEWTGKFFFLFLSQFSDVGDDQ